MITVNPSTRHFNIPGSDLVFGVMDDANAEIKEFQCPRYVGNSLDLMGCFIRINYRNANGEIDSYLVPKLTLDGDNIRFGWELTSKVTMYKGNISFVLCAVGPDTKVKWHTTLGRGQVLEGLEPDNAMIEEGTADVVAQLIALVESQAAAVEKAGADQVAVVKAAAKAAQDSAVAEIEAKRKNSLESIPADYTSLENTVDGLIRGRAGAIVCEVSGSAVAVNDASDNYICGMRIFGRSTQDGTPTPDAPVEIKSVESPVVRACGKNLFPGHVTNYQNEDGSTVTVNADGSITVHKVAGAGLSFRENIYFPAGTYVISNGLDDGHPVYLQAFNEALYSVASKVVKWPGGMASVFIYSRETTEADVTLFPQIELSDARTDYEPYKPVQTVETTHTLHGIPVTSGGNYTDENGQQWICDEIDLERGVYMQRIYEQTILANKITTIDTSFLEFGAYCSVISDVPMLVDTRIKLTMSDFALGVPTDDRNRPEYTPWYRTYHSGGSGFVIRYPASVGMKTIEEARVDFAGKKIRYVLATPIETPLTETELAAYRALRSNYPNTTILNDAGAHMAVKYAADTKLYIDNKIAALIGG